MMSDDPSLWSNRGLKDLKQLLKPVSCPVTSLPSFTYTGSLHLHQPPPSPNTWMQFAIYLKDSFLSDQKGACGRPNRPNMEGLREGSALTTLVLPKWLNILW